MYIEYSIIQGIFNAKINWYKVNDNDHDEKYNIYAEFTKNIEILDDKEEYNNFGYIAIKKD